MRTGRSAARRRAAMPMTRLAGLATLGLGAMTVMVEAASRAAERRHRPTGRMITVDGVRIHVMERGPRTAPPILLLHGNGAMIADWEISGILPALAEGHRVIAIDRPGYGHTDRPRDRLWTPRAQARLVWRLLDRLGVDRPVVVGHSWGTLVSLAMAVQAPRRVAGLVLLSGYYYPSPRLDAVLFAPQATPVLGDLLNRTVNPLLGAAIGPALIARMFTPTRVTSRFKAEFPLSMALRPGQLRAFGEASTLLVPGAASLQGHYATLDVPAIILAGTEDRIVSTSAQSVRLAEALPNAELRLFRGLGHMMHHFAPDAVVDAAARLARIADAPAAPTEPLRFAMA